MIENTEKKSPPLEYLPEIQGKYIPNAPLASLTWFQVGGCASFLFKPSDTNDLAHFLKKRPLNVSYFILGAGSNILIRDGGYEGVVIKLGRNFATTILEGDLLIAGAAALDRTVSMTALEHAVQGLEFLVTIPGSIGGAVTMNAGCYGVEVKDVLAWVECLNDQGSIVRLTPKELNMRYRKTDFPAGYIILRAAFYAKIGSKDIIKEKMQQYLKLREDSQPTKGRTGGSTFKNPDNAKAWELIDKAQCRGLTIGGAKMSEKHCNFMMNTGGATASDLEKLGEHVRQKVKEKTGYNLEWEIVRLGKA